MSSNKGRLHTSSSTSRNRQTYTDKGSPVIPMHRALRRNHLGVYRVLQSLLLPVLFSLLSMALMPLVSIVNGYIYSFWIDKLELPAQVLSRAVQLPLFPFNTSVLSLQDVAPVADLWQPLLIFTLLMFLLSFAIRESWLPLRYLIRTVVIVQGLTLLIVATGYQELPHTVDGHIELINYSVLFLVFVVPCIYALVYYPMEFSLWKKISLTAISILYLLMLAPMLSLLHAYSIYHFSILVMPALYFFLGILVPVIGCIALYGWAMSWR